MLVVLGVLILLLSALGGIYMHLFVWPQAHPDRGWPWRLWASLVGPALAGVGLIVGSWMIVGVGAAAWLLARLVKDDSLERLGR